MILLIHEVKAQVYLYCISRADIKATIFNFLVCMSFQSNSTNKYVLYLSDNLAMGLEMWHTPSTDTTFATTAE